jgi:hypothetical protein
MKRIPGPPATTAAVPPSASMCRGRLAAIATSCVLLWTAVVSATPAYAHGDTPLVVCPGYVEQSISPGLTVLPRDNTVSVSGRFGPCVNKIIDPEHAFADYTASADGVLSCTINAPITNATGTVRWENTSGRHTGTSHFTGGITLSQRPLGENVGIVTATITSGEFTGRTLVLVSARLTIEPTRCLTSGVRYVAGPGSLEILPT